MFLSPAYCSYHREEMVDLLLRFGIALVMLAWFWSLLTPRVPLLSALHLQETPRYRATYRGGGGVVVRLAELAE